MSRAETSEKVYLVATKQVGKLGRELSSHNLDRPDNERQFMSEIMLTKEMCRETMKKREEQRPERVLPSPNSSEEVQTKAPNWE